MLRLCPDASEKTRIGTVKVVKDGITITANSGSEIRINPGESLTLVPGAFHTFWADPDGGPVMVGEVSSVNDDNTDNCFAEKRERFQKWIEDVPAKRLAVSDYSTFFEE